MKLINILAEIGTCYSLIRYNMETTNKKQLQTMGIYGIKTV